MSDEFETKEVKFKTGSELVYLCPGCGAEPLAQPVELGIPQSPCENPDCIVRSWDYRVGNDE